MGRHPENKVEVRERVESRGISVEYSGRGSEKSLTGEKRNGSRKWSVTGIWSKKNVLGERNQLHKNWIYLKDYAKGEGSQLYEN